MENRQDKNWIGLWGYLCYHLSSYLYIVILFICYCFNISALIHVRQLAYKKKYPSINPLHKLYAITKIHPEVFFSKAISLLQGSNRKVNNYLIRIMSYWPNIFICTILIMHTQYCIESGSLNLDESCIISEAVDISSSWNPISEGTCDTFTQSLPFYSPVFSLCIQYSP